jgi:hypothetical protein
MLFLLEANLAFSQSAKNGFNNTVFISLDPEVTTLSYLLLGVKGFGLEAAYERRVLPGYSLAGDVKGVFLDAEGSRFSAWELSVHNRFAAGSNFFFSIKAAVLLYASPYYSGVSFGPGFEAGYRFTLKQRFVIEPYFGCIALTDDKFVIPWTIMALSEYVIPNFTIGVRYGINF